jgi:hypothetical protein
VTSTHRNAIPERFSLIFATVDVDPAGRLLFPYPHTKEIYLTKEVRKKLITGQMEISGT